MDLFEGSKEQPRNLLHRDGYVQYFDDFLDQDVAQTFFDLLLEEIDWHHDQAVIMGKTITTNRKVSWYGDQPFAYHYSRTKKVAKPWTEALLEMKTTVEKKTGETFNACLLNLYHDGSEGMAWHSDAERELKKYATIASVSLGAERKFAFKHKKSAEKIDLILRDGSLLLMKDQTQSHWLHRLPPTTKVKNARINLTFRTMNPQKCHTF